MLKGRFKRRKMVIFYRKLPFRAVPLMPTQCSRPEMKMLWSTVSTAADKSKSHINFREADRILCVCAAFEDKVGTTSEARGSNSRRPAPGVEPCTRTGKKTTHVQ